MPSRTAVGGPGSNQHAIKPPLPPRDVAPGAGGTGAPPPPTDDPLGGDGPRFDAPSVVSRDRSWFGIDEDTASQMTAALADLGVNASWVANDGGYDEESDPDEWSDDTGTLHANYLLGDPSEQPTIPDPALANDDVQAFVAGDIDRWDAASEALVEHIDDYMDGFLESADLPLPDESATATWSRDPS